METFYKTESAIPRQMSYSMEVRMRYLPLAIMGSAACAAVLAAQLKVDVALVNVVATVTDGRGRYVAGLSQEDFILEEDGEPQQISHFTYSDDVPVSMGIVLDASGSMERKISTATSAVERFTRMIHEDDDIFLMTFADTPRLRQDFTDDRQAFAAALRQLRVAGGTALYDALAEGLRKVRTGKHSKKAILLITDGQDTSSYLDFDRAASHVRESEILVYALGIAPSFEAMSERVPVPTGPRTGPSTRRRPRINIPGIPGIPDWPFELQQRRRPAPGSQAGMDTVDMDVLNAFADASGGKAWLLSSNTDRNNRMQDALDEIADELRNQYSIGYYPPHPLKDGKWHRIEIRTTNPRYNVRARKDYFGQ
jgi:Ca-activated chloride channel family protein